MGACGSRSREEGGGGGGGGARRRRRSEDVAGVPTGGNRPLRPRKSFTWTSDKPLTREELTTQREAFWDTQPSYSGRTEVWAALRAACEAQTLEEAQSFLNGANIILPTGNLADGCYDELGNQYTIPVMCYVDPTNLLQTPKPSTSTTTLQPPPPTTTPTNLPTFTLILRLSTGTDLKLPVTKASTIRNIKDQIFSTQNTDASKTRLRIFHLGRQLSDETTVGKLELGEGGLIQVMVTPLGEGK
ncbi:Ubiquitin domain-containing protein 2 [Rhizophlyctis rosea]|nr:Ubiquitin domain-containing protein 2 [Rhizophlyctis rosea]